MRINYCDGYYREGENFYWHNKKTGRDYIVSEDEAMAHKPEVLLDEFYDLHETPSDDEVLAEYKKYNSYQDVIHMLEDVIKHLEEAGDLDAVGVVYDAVLWFKAQQEVSLRKIGIIF